MNSVPNADERTTVPFAIEIDNIEVALSGNRILRGVTLAAAEDEIVGILGPSGSGKTTLLRALAGLVPLRSGQIRIAGRDQEGVSSWARDIGLVFQSSNALFPHLSVYENVGFPFRRGGKRPPSGFWKDAVLEILSITGLSEYAKRSLATLSGGQLQRVALARALVYRPRILLLDEPLSSLDNCLKQSLLDLLVDLKTKYGGTFIYVSHDEREIRYLSDRVAILIDGHIAQLGSIDEVWSRPIFPEVAQLIGGWNILARVDPKAGTKDVDRLRNQYDEKTIGVPVNRTLFVLQDHGVPTGCVAIEAVVTRFTLTPNGTEVHCITQNGERIVAVTSVKDFDDVTAGTVVFDQGDIHSFRKYDHHK